MYELVNLAIVAAIGVCLYAARYRNLFQCALLLGKCLFALLLALALFDPAARSMARPLSLPLPYVNAGAFFLIWVIVLAAFEPVAFRVLKTDGRGMKFRYELPGQIVIGLISGVLASCALSINAVMVPPLEGLYFKNGAQPIAQLQRKAALVFRVCTLTSHDVVAPAQMEAGAHWLKAQLKRRGQADYNADVEGLVPVFEERYRRAVEAKTVRQRRQALLKELQDILATPPSEASSVGKGQPAQALPNKGQQEGRPAEGPTQPASGKGGQPTAPASGPAFDLTLVQGLVRTCRFEEALTAVAELKERYREPPQAEWLRKEEERLRSLQEMHAELVRRAEEGARPGLPRGGRLVGRSGGVLCEAQRAVRASRIAAHGGTVGVRLPRW